MGIGKIFKIISLIGQYGTAISNISRVAESEFKKIHPEWFEDKSVSQPKEEIEESKEENAQ
jgi:hypothetical protein